MDNNYNSAPQNDGSGMATAALVCGILGLIGSWIPVVQYFTTLLSILAIIFGAISRKKVPVNKRGMATAGLVLGIIALALGLLGILCLAALCSAAVPSLVF